MLKIVINRIIEVLEQAGNENVYSAFDAYSIDKKGSLFIVVSVGAFETSAPIYSMYYAYLPFKAEAEQNVTAAKSMSMAELYDYYETFVEPALVKLTDINCSLKKVAMKYDSNIQRLVLTVKIDVSGINRIERGNE